MFEGLVLDNEYVKDGNVITLWSLSHEVREAHIDRVSQNLAKDRYFKYQVPWDTIRSEAVQRLEFFQFDEHGQIVGFL